MLHFTMHDPFVFLAKTNFLPEAPGHKDAGGRFGFVSFLYAIAQKQRHSYKEGKFVARNIRGNFRARKINISNVMSSSIYRALMFSRTFSGRVFSGKSSPSFTKPWIMR